MEASQKNISVIYRNCTGLTLLQLLSLQNIEIHIDYEDSKTSGLYVQSTCQTHGKTAQALTLCTSEEHTGWNAK